MRAIWMHRFGGPEVLVAGHAPDPVPAPGQVVVDVAYVNVTFVETQFRATGFGPHGHEPPLIPGNGVGGIVRSVGEGVDRSVVGQRVVTSTGGSGAYAERVAVDAAALIAVPDVVALDDAVALLADGRTAMWLVTSAELEAGDRVLVEAAAGGVGTLLVQLARASGARVIGVARGDRKVALVRELGADVAVDYGDPSWVDDVRGATGGVDVVFDGVGGEIATGAFGLVRPGGRMITYGAASGQWATIDADLAAARDVQVGRGSPLSPREMRAFAEGALQEAAAGRLRPVIGQRFPLERAADAHAAIEARATIGKTLLEVLPR
jgi:NADPH2:quinone reductase